MRFNVATWLPCLALAWTSGCAAGEIDGGRDLDELTDATGLTIRIETASGTHAATDTPFVDVTYTNESSRAIRLLSWTLPSDELWEDLFVVTLDGVEAPYIGRIYKRPDPQAKDFVVLEPGESLSGSVDLSRLYDLPHTGRYEVQMEVAPASLTASASAFTPTLLSNRVALLAEGRSRPLRIEEPVSYYYGIGYSGCSSWQKADVVTGMEWAEWYAQDAADFMNQSTPGNRPRYKKWFGNYSASRWNKVKNVWNTMLSRINNKRMSFHCDCDEDYYAYVYPDAPYHIYLCNIYWDASLDDKGGTVVHELSHFYAVAGTDDVTYGSSSCLQLARSSPGQAVNNADNYAYFVQLP